MKKLLENGIALICLVAALGGCTTAATVPAEEKVTPSKAEAYSMGTYSALFDATLVKVSGVICNVAADAKFTEVRRESTSRSCYFHYRDRKGVDCEIQAAMSKRGQVQVSIKVGASGSKRSSRALMSEISARLGKQ